MEQQKFEKMALYRNKDFLIRNIGIKEFNKQIKELITGISPLITTRYESMYYITYNIDYYYSDKSIYFICTNFKTYKIEDDDITFKRKNGIYKTKINFEPFLNWYKYELIPELKELIKDKEHKYTYNPYLETHISSILSQNRIDYINKILYD